MNRHSFKAGVCLAAAVFSFAVVPRSFGQAAPASPPAAGTISETTEEVVKLSPFVVDSFKEKESYQATSTLAGTRVRTELKDVASALSVDTAQFMRDIGATNNATLLQYTPNTEVGGMYGNYSGVGNTFIQGARDGQTQFTTSTSDNRPDNTPSGSKK
jgi:outer membrane receptor protein involved in Fe transport